jgi:heptosyltransferase-1
VVHSLPFLDSLSRCFPEASIDWVISSGLEGLLEGHPMIRRLVVIHKDSWKRPANAAATVGEISRLARSLRAEQYDLTVDLQGLLRSGIITMMSGSPVRLGFAEAREGSVLCYNRKVEGGRDLHAVDRYLKIAAALGCVTLPVRFPFPSHVPSADMVLPERYAVLVPGARWDTKRWPAESFGAVAARLEIPSLVVGSASDSGIAERVVAGSNGMAKSLAGKTDLRGLMEVMRRAAVVISNDSGPMHIAAGFGVPVVAVFGPTSPGRTGPYGAGHVVISSPVPCAPCFRRNCGDLKCMRAITPDKVFEAAMRILQH